MQREYLSRGKGSSVPLKFAVLAHGVLVQVRRPDARALFPELEHRADRRLNSDARPESVEISTAFVEGTELPSRVIEVEVPDLDAAKAWYAKVFQTEPYYTIRRPM